MGSGWKSRLSLIKKAVDLDPNNGAYLDSLGWAYFKLNRVDEAETYLKKALDRVRKDPTIHEHLGDVYYHKGQYAEAEQPGNCLWPMGRTKKRLEKSRRRLKT